MLVCQEGRWAITGRPDSSLASSSSLEAELWPARKLQGENLRGSQRMHPASAVAIPAMRQLCAGNEHYSPSIAYQCRHKAWAYAPYLFLFICLLLASRTLPSPLFQSSKSCCCVRPPMSRPSCLSIRVCACVHTTPRSPPFLQDSAYKRLPFTQFSLILGRNSRKGL